MSLLNLPLVQNTSADQQVEVSQEDHELPAKESPLTKRKGSDGSLQETVRVLEEYIAEVRTSIRGKKALI